MKRITLIILAVAAIIAGSVSCQKVNDLDKRLTELEQTVSDLKAQILAGAVITSVDKTADGCTFTLSNGQSYTVTNGKNGSDGEAIIADVKIEENFIVLTLKNGETLRISYQNPLSMVTLNIVPDYDDGTVWEPNTTEYNGEKSTIFYLDIEVTPAKYAEILSDTERFIHKAVFSPVLTKSGFGNAFTVSPKRVTYCEGAPIPFLEASFELDDEIASLLLNNNSAYTVSYSIEDKDGVHGAATSFVTISHEKGSGGGETDNTTIPAGALPGVFTVGKGPDGQAGTADDIKVYFSKGNLYWDGDSFEFEASQISSQRRWDKSHVSHFFWSKDARVAYSEKYDNANRTFGITPSEDDVLFTNDPVDEGKANNSFTVNGVTGKYRILNNDEWEYLLNTRKVNQRSGEGWSYSFADGGLILYPDNYKGSVIKGYNNLSEGVVFLTYAGYCKERTYTKVASDGYYWSTHTKGKNPYSAYDLHFNSNKIGFRDDYYACDKYVGHSIRLVTDVE